MCPSASAFISPTSGFTARRQWAIALRSHHQTRSNQKERFIWKTSAIIRVIHIAAVGNTDQMLIGYDNAERHSNTRWKRNANTENEAFAGDRFPNKSIMIQSRNNIIRSSTRQHMQRHIWSGGGHPVRDYAHEQIGVRCCRNRFQCPRSLGGSDVRAHSTEHEGNATDVQSREWLYQTSGS